MRYVILDLRTGHVVSTAATRATARRRADQLDAAYGAVRYAVRGQPVSHSPSSVAVCGIAGPEFQARRETACADVHTAHAEPAEARASVDADAICVNAPNLGQFSQLGVSARPFNDVEFRARMSRAVATSPTVTVVTPHTEPRKVCSYCAEVMRDGVEPASHGICATCQRRFFEVR